MDHYTSCQRKWKYVSLLCLLASVLWGQVTVAPTGSNALLDIVSTSQGVLTPRMTADQKNNIASPAVGLLIFQVDSMAGYYFFTGSQWKYLSTLVLLEDADGDTKIQVEESTDEDIIRIDLGGTEHVVLQKNGAGDVRLEFSGNGGSVFIGNDVGKNTSALNFALGDSALLNTTTGVNNLAIGHKALYQNITGKENFAIGTSALLNTTADSNMAIGYQALMTNTVGMKNLGIGFESLRSNVDGNDNYGIGYQALLSNTIGSRNLAIGSWALKSNTEGNDNLALGSDVFDSNASGSRNTALGLFTTLTSNTDGYDNCAIGYHAMEDPVSNYQTLALGTSTLRNLTTGLGNTAIGNSTLFDLLTGENNTAFGYAALRYITSGSRNTAFGAYSLVNYTGSNNTFFGADGNTSTTTFESGITSIGGSTDPRNDYVTLLGYGANSSLTINTTHSTAIGNFQNVSESHCISIGIADKYRVGIGTTTPDTNAILDLYSTTRGFLPPRKDYNTYNSIFNPPPGTLLYDPDLRALYFKSVTSGWFQLNNAFDGPNNPLENLLPVWRNNQWDWSYPDAVADADGDTRLQIEKNPDEDKFRIRIKDKERYRIERNVNGKELHFVFGDNNSIYLGTAAGELAMPTATNNVGIGFSALKVVNAQGSYNTAIGADALSQTTSGSENTVIGNSAMLDNTLGSFNTAIGNDALRSNTTGDYNVAIGVHSLDGNVTNEYNTAIGHHADVNSGGFNNATAIGNYARPNASNALILGKIAGVNGASVSDRVGMGTTEPAANLHIVREAYGSNAMILLQEPALNFSRIKFRNGSTADEWAMMGRANATLADARFNFFYDQVELSLHGNGDVVLTGTLFENSDRTLKRNIQKLKFDLRDFMQVKPKTYYWKNEAKGAKQQLGFIAQEIQDLYPSLVSSNEGLLVLNYQGFVPILVEGVKELDLMIQRNDRKLKEVKGILASLQINPE
jgi:trimeric autotransporter adhesin